MKTTITKLQCWYRLNCNGDWEHSYGISIGNIDNPGWSIKIDLKDTSLDELVYSKSFQSKQDEFDWYDFKTENECMQIFCGPDNLDQVIEIFLDEIIPLHSNPSFTYDIYLPLKGMETEIWTPAKAKVISYKDIQLTEILEINPRNIKVKTIDILNTVEINLDILQLAHEIGDIVDTELVQVYDGLVLCAKSKQIHRNLEHEK